MKVVFASTPEQEEKIGDLIQKMYTHVFPLYFSDEDIMEFEQLQVLHTTTRHFEYFGTLRDAYQVIVSLQTIIAILESTSIEERYEEIFNVNVETLQEFGLSFPFQFRNFFNGRMLKNDFLSIYTKADNEILI